MNAPSPLEDLSVAPGLPPGAVPEALGECIGYLLGRSHALIRSRAELAFAEKGLSVKEYGVLCILHAEESSSQQALAERLGVDRTTMSSTVDGLVRRSLVRRTRNPRDRRAYRVWMTAEGYRTAEEIEERAAAIDKEFTDRLSEDEARRLKELLGKLIASWG
ncbi:MarR family winged helix-turn-helix transcriptional regulator [Streptomyces sp. LX-29]|uniref:MarR family winged helix-turn-helix transcriptional regulator n=1 Tax=Streptomyces sp. LX-29 TaxID=2900152 RepID=UPI00240D3083|nr:MarR family winged helix-turn-helix transcriptional regulator [Streptomyces sp. LX-29]WFB10932.1 MarR family winged helix-turn-helix transcriptional regulator [Streptomyces sp. LX-29]